MTCPRTGTPSRTPAATIAAAFAHCRPDRVPVAEAAPPEGAQATPAGPGPCPRLPTTATTTPNTHSHTPSRAPAIAIHVPASTQLYPNILRLIWIQSIG